MCIKVGSKKYPIILIVVYDVNIYILIVLTHNGMASIKEISRSVLLRMRNVSDKTVEKIKTQILCSITFFFSKPVLFKR